MGLISITSAYVAESNLESIFKDPPMKMRPYVWWHSSPLIELLCQEAKALPAK